MSQLHMARRAGAPISLAVAKRTARSWSYAASVTVLASTGCGGTGERPAPAQPFPPLVRTAESRADVAAMLVEVMASEICGQLRGRFLPIGDVKAGAVPRGDEPVGGRWWVRDCRAKAFGGQVALYLQGAGWAWGDASEGMLGVEFGVRDYVYFAAAGTVVGTVDMSFDAVRRIAWGQFAPTMHPYVATGLTRHVETEGNWAGSIASFISFGALGSYADGRANEKATTMIANSFTELLTSGFVFTFDVVRRQPDAYAAGKAAPRHPFNDDTRWLVNEQQVLRRKPGGVHVVGPFAPTQAAGVDFSVDEGMVHYRAECEADVIRWFEPTAHGRWPELPPARHAQTGLVSAGGATRRTVGAACPWYLITQPLTEKAVANVRVRADTTGYPMAGP